MTKRQSPKKSQPTKVFVALPAYGEVPIGFVQSLLRLMVDQTISMTIRFAAGDSLVSRARNRLVADFLEQKDCTHLLFIDTDLIFSAEQIARLVSHDVPIVGGFYPKKQQGPIEWVCNTLDGRPDRNGRGLQPLRYIGTGFLLIRREVFEAHIRAFGNEIAYIADHTNRLEHDFFAVGVHHSGPGPGRYLSEDWLFCQRCLDLDYEVFGDPNVILRHIGAATYPLKTQEPELFAAKPAPESPVDV